MLPDWCVRQYLHEFDLALGVLPRAQASELKDQITAHIDESLAPNASDDEVTETLSHLGSVHDVMTEATGREHISLTRRARARLRSLRWWWWAALAAVVAAGGTFIGLTVSMEVTSPLVSNGFYAWWGHVTNEVNTSADGLDQSTIRIDPGHVQGFVISIYNPSGWSQTVTSGSGGLWLGGGPAQIAVSSKCSARTCFASYASIPYHSVETIPPHQWRLLRVTGRSQSCLFIQGSEAVWTAVTIEVRVRWITRTESIGLDPGMGVSGYHEPGCPRGS